MLTSAGMLILKIYKQQFSWQEVKLGAFVFHSTVIVIFGYANSITICGCHTRVKSYNPGATGNVLPIRILNLGHDCNCCVTVCQMCTVCYILKSGATLNDPSIYFLKSHHWFNISKVKGE